MGRGREKPKSDTVGKEGPGRTGGENNARECCLEMSFALRFLVPKGPPGQLMPLWFSRCLFRQQKLKQDIARQKSSLEATREMVTRFMETANSSTASALQGKLAEVTEHFNKLCRRQQEKENVLKGLLPKVEQYEHLSEKLQQFTESRARMLASGNQPDRDIAHFSQQIQVRSGFCA